MNSTRSMSIRKAVEQIAGREIQIPTFKERFGCYPRQIEYFFNSILRGYPLGSFLFWSPGTLFASLEYYDLNPDITERQIAFLRCEEPACRAGTRPRWVVLDGMKRLYALYVGLKGSFCFSRPFSFCPDEDKVRIRKLCLRLCGPSLPEDEELSPAGVERNHFFRFLSDEEYENEKRAGNIWVRAGRLHDEKPDALADSLPILFADHAEAVALLKKFSVRINREKSIGFSVLERIPPEEVLDFCVHSLDEMEYGPTCKDGVFLALAAAHGSFRYPGLHEEFWLLEKDIRDLSEASARAGGPEFYVDLDFIRQICLYLTGGFPNFSFRHHMENMKLYDEEWDRIKSSIIAAHISFVLANVSGLDYLNSVALFPVIYWMYKYREKRFPAGERVPEILYEIDTNDKYRMPMFSSFSHEEITAIRKWTAIYNIMEGFGCSLFDDDRIAFRLRKVIDDAESAEFPVDALQKELKLSSLHSFDDLTFDEYLDILLSEPCDDSRNQAVLDLLYLSACPQIPRNTFLKPRGPLMQRVHLHSARFFTNPDELNKNFRGAEEILFASDESNWNSIANLRLEPAGTETAETGKPLAEWAAENNITNRELFLDDGVSLDIKDFRAFIENRRKNIKAVLHELLD